MLPNFVICLVWCLNFSIHTDAKAFINARINAKKPPKIVRIGVGTFPNKEEAVDQRLENRKNSKLVDVAVKQQHPINEISTLSGCSTASDCALLHTNIDPEKIQISTPTKKLFSPAAAAVNNRNFNLNLSNRLALPLLGRALTGTDTINSKSKANVQLGTNPNFSLSRIFDLLNLYQSRDVLQKTGVRDNANFGTGYESNTNILYGLTNLLNSFDANYNLRNGLDVNVRKGIAGLYTEDDVTNVNPLALSFGNRKQICIAEFLFKGLCFQRQVGLLKRRRRKR